MEKPTPTLLLPGGSQPVGMQVSAGHLGDPLTGQPSEDADLDRSMDGPSSISPQEEEEQMDWGEGLQSQTEADIDPNIAFTEEALSDPEEFWEDQWRLFEPYVRPYEVDRREYRHYPRPLVITVRGILWLRLTKNNNLRNVVDGFMIMGLIPQDLKQIDDTSSVAALSTSGLNPNDDSQLALSPPPPPPDVQFVLVEQHKGAASGRGVSFDEVEPSERVKDLEYEVKELTRQLRLLKSRDAPASNAGSGSSSPIVPPMPHILAKGSYVASINGNTPVCLQLNYLEPDMAPYCVSFSGNTGRQVLPCTIVNHRYILFIAPAHPGGSVAVTVLCTAPNGQLRKYTRGTWLEYKDLGQSLTHHAVNQLVAEVPLPTSTSAPDPSEVGVNTEGKSEGDVLEDVETATALSDNTTLVTPQDDHPPLTREMLDMLQQPRVMFRVVPPNRLEEEGESPQGPVSKASVSMLSVDGTDTVASSMAITHGTHGGSILMEGGSQMSAGSPQSAGGSVDDVAAGNDDDDDDVVSGSPVP